jgi:hypothetical protein
MTAKPEPGPNRPEPRHWAYNLPTIIDPEKGPIYWAPEAISEHKYPEYWAQMWGYSMAQIEAAKGAAQ